MNGHGVCRSRKATSLAPATKTGQFETGPISPIIGRVNEWQLPAPPFAPVYGGYVRASCPRHQVKRTAAWLILAPQTGQAGDGPIRVRSKFAPMRDHWPLAAWSLYEWYGPRRLLNRYFATNDISELSPTALAAGIERCQVDLGLEQDRGKRFALWALLHMLGAAPDREVAFDEDGDRDAARNFMELLEASGPE